jgi:hypothetical protein
VPYGSEKRACSSAARLDLANLQGQLEKLRKARAAGVRKVSYGNGPVSREVEYRSDSELAAAIADLEKQIAGVQGRRITRVRVTSSKGL